MTIAPWYSITGDAYHVRDDCGQSQGVGKDQRRSGTGGKLLCQTCFLLLSRDLFFNP